MNKDKYINSIEVLGVGRSTHLSAPAVRCNLVRIAPGNVPERWETKVVLLHAEIC